MAKKTKKKKKKRRRLCPPLERFVGSFIVKRRKTGFQIRIRIGANMHSLGKSWSSKLASDLHMFLVVVFWVTD